MPPFLSCKFFITLFEIREKKKEEEEEEEEKEEKVDILFFL